MAIRKIWDETKNAWVVVGNSNIFENVTQQINGAPWVTINIDMPSFELNPDKFTIDNAFTFWNRVLLQPTQTINYVALGGDKLKTDLITFKFDTTISVEIRPVSVPLYSNRNSPSVIIA